MTIIYSNNIGHLAYTQNKSFYNFILLGVEEEIKQLNNPVLINFKVDRLYIYLYIYLYYMDIKLRLDENISFNECISNFITYQCSIFIPAEYNFLNSNLNIEKDKNYLTNLNENYISFKSLNILKNSFDIFEKVIKNSLKKTNSFFKKSDYKDTFFLNRNKKHFKQDLLLAEIPMLTEEGTFLINGCERIVINQIIRSPGIYFRKNYKINGTIEYTGSLISNKGNSLNISLVENNNSDSLVVTFPYFESNILYNKLKNNNFNFLSKLNIFFLLKYFGISFYELLDNTCNSLSNIKKLNSFFKKKNSNIEKKFKNSIYLIDEYFDSFPNLYNFKNISHKLDINHISTIKDIKYYINNKDYITSFDDIKYIDDIIKEILKNKEKLPFKYLKKIKLAENKKLLVYLLNSFFKFNSKYNFKIGEIGRYQLNKQLNLNISLKWPLFSAIDFLEICKKLIEIKYSNSQANFDIDNLKYKKLRSVGDFLQNELAININQIKKKINRPIKITSETFKNYYINNKSISKFLNPYSLTRSIKEFFATSDVSQFMDQINSLSEIAQKRRVSLFGPHGLNRDQVSIDIRGIQKNQYGKLCPIDTPEGQSAGVVSSLSILSNVSTLGLLETPYFFKKHNVIFSKYRKPIYLNGYQEDLKNTAFGNIKLDKNYYFKNKYIISKSESSLSYKKEDTVPFINISAWQFLSLSTLLVPFLEHNDAIRTLMGSNMQRQTVPLLYKQLPIISTGFESCVPAESQFSIKSYSEGFVYFTSSSKIVIEDNKKNKLTYVLLKYKNSNQCTFINQTPLVWVGEKVFSGQIIADGSDSDQGELSLGKNLTVAYLPWEGYNYEDALIINEKLITNNILTSLHIQELECNLTSDDLITDYCNPCIKFTDNFYINRHLSPSGIAKIGSYLKKGDTILGKITDLILEKSLKIKDDSKEFSENNNHDLIEKLDSENSNFISSELENYIDDEILIKNYSELFNEKGHFNSNVKPIEFNGAFVRRLLGYIKGYFKESSISISDDFEGRLIDIRLNYDEFYKNINGENLLIPFTIKFYIAQIRNIEVGDKLAGRHGNKGIISRILSEKDMPFLPDGSSIDIIFNPLGVPSRMNVGQLLETLLGFACDKLNERLQILPFDEVYAPEASNILLDKKFKNMSKIMNTSWLYNKSHIGKIFLRDGRTGEFFDNPITVGKSYIIKLIHLVEDKLNARSQGSYSAINDQPFSGRSRGGGQRFGEMESWALEAYGCSLTLQELFTIKSDSVMNRTYIFESIIKNKEFPSLGIPDGLLILGRELNSLGLDFNFYKIPNLFNNKLTENPELIDIFKLIEEQLKFYKVYENSKKVRPLQTYEDSEIMDYDEFMTEYPLSRDELKKKYFSSKYYEINTSDIYNYDEDTESE